MLTAEDGTGLANADSFCDVAFGDAYAANRLYSAEWIAATTALKEAALKTSTRVIEMSVEWSGQRKTTTQALGWPRLYSPQFFNYTDGYYTYYDSASVPKGVKDATIELAIMLLKSDRTADAPGKGIASFGVGQGAVEVAFNTEDAREMFTDVVALLLRPFGTILTGKGARYVQMHRV